MPNFKKTLLQLDCRFADWPCWLVAGLAVAAIVCPLVEFAAR